MGFFDWGYANINNPLVGEEQDKVFHSIGCGLRIHLFDKFYGRLEWGFQQGDEGISGNSAFHFMIQTELM